MRVWLLQLALVCAASEIRTAECRTACGWAGYDSGAYKSNKCLCIDEKNYVEMANKKRIIIKGKTTKASELSY